MTDPTNDAAPPVPPDGKLVCRNLWKLFGPRGPETLAALGGDPAPGQLQAAGATEVVPEAVEGSLMLASHALALVGVPMRRVIRIVQEQRVSVWYTAPTAVRMLMKAGTEVARAHDFGHLRFVSSVGRSWVGGA